MHDTEEFESLQNIIPNRNNKTNIAILRKHQNNYCRKKNTPKIVKQVSHASQYNRVPLQIVIAQFQYTNL
jgi:hypothetical protein